MGTGDGGRGETRMTNSFQYFMKSIDSSQRSHLDGIDRPSAAIKRDTFGKSSELQSRVARPVLHRRNVHRDNEALRISVINNC